MAGNSAIIMSTSKTILVSAVVALLVAWAVGIVFRPAVLPPSLGGLEHNIRENYREGINLSAIGGFGILDTASGSRTFTAAEICDNTLVTIDGDTFASTQPQKMPSGASLIQDCLPNKGDYRNVLFWNDSIDELPTINTSTNANLDAFIASGSATNGTFNNITADGGVWVKFMNFDGSTVSLTFEEVKDSD